MITQRNGALSSSNNCAPVVIQHAPSIFPIESRREKVEPHSTMEMLWLEITQRCNLDCIHCYADSGYNRSLAESMRFEDWISTLHQAFELGCCKVQFTGGEPLMVPYIQDLVVKASQIGYEHIEVFTNGTLLSHQLRTTLQKLPITLAFSIYSSQDVIHDTITRTKGSFKKTIEAISWAVKANFQVQASVIGMKINSHDIEHTVSFLRGLGVGNIALDKVRAAGRGILLTEEKTPFRDSCKNCFLKKLCIDASGRVLPCIFSRSHALGHISDGLQNLCGPATRQNSTIKIH